MKKLDRKKHCGILFAAAYALCLADSLLTAYSTFSALKHVGRISDGLCAMAGFLMLAKLALDGDYTPRTLIKTGAAGLLLAVTFFSSRYDHLYYLMLMVAGIRKTEMEKIVRLDFKLRLGLCAVIMVSGLTGVIENYVTWRTGSDVLRYSVGFNHPNTLASMAFSLILEDLWLRKRKFSLKYAGIVWGIAAAVYVITQNRTAVLLMLLLPFALLFVNRQGEKSIAGCERQVYLWAFAAAAVFSVLMMLLTDYCAPVNAVDELLSNRFHNAYRVYRNHGISLLGQRVKLVSVKMARLENTSIALLDIAYLRALIQAGPLVLALTAFAAFGICESGYNNVFMNFSLLFMAEALHLPMNDRGGLLKEMSRWRESFGSKR